MVHCNKLGRTGDAALTSARPALTAGALSLGLHAALLLSWPGTGGAPVLHPRPPRPVPVEVEVMRLAGIVAPQHLAATAGSGLEPLLVAAQQAAHGPPARVRAPGSRAGPGLADAPAGPATQPNPTAAPPTEPPAKPVTPLSPTAAQSAESATQLGPTNAATASSSCAQAEGCAASGSPRSSPSTGALTAGGESNPAEGAEGFDTSDLSRRLQAGALRCYPPAARRFRQLGQAQIRFCLDGAGALRESSVSASSGFELLDRAARECVVPGAAPFGPEAFGRCFTVPVRFHQ